MSGHLRINLRAGERIFLNGAVIKVDRKVGVELLNDVVFLLEQHVMKPEETTTPLKQLYFMIQMMLIDPALRLKARAMALESISEQVQTFADQQIKSGLAEVEKFLQADRPLEALKKTRSLFSLEETVLGVAQELPKEKKEVA